MSDSTLILAQPEERDFSILPGLNTKSCLEAALVYAALGWRVIPIAGVSTSLGYCRCSRGYRCDSPGKHPLTEHGLKDATTDPETLQRLFHRWPWANVGIVTGATSGLVVVDVDNASSSLRFDTLTVNTSGYRHHLYFSLDGQQVPSSVSKVARGVDVRGEGGYVVAPPSDHKSGGQYQWRPGNQLAPFPTEILAQGGAAPSTCASGGSTAPTKRTTKVSGAAEPKPDSEGRTICEGHRNSELFKIACALRGRGQSKAEILAELLRVNGERCQPPLGEAEVRRIGESGAKQEPTQTPEQVIRKLVKMSPIEYDKNRAAAAEQLGIRVTTLDEEVEKQRGLTSAKIEEQRDQREWERLKAGPAEDGVKLLADIVLLLKRFLYLTEAQYTIVALWALLTHVLQAFDFSPYLNTWSATKGCGKSRLLEVLKLIVARPWYTMRTTASALLRKVAQVTLLLDERDTAFNCNKEYGEALRGILNAGFSREGKVTLSEKDANGNWVAVDIPVFGAKAIGGIGHLPETVADRSFPILMLKKPPRVKLEKLRMSGKIGAEIKADAEALRKRMERWAAQNIDRLREADPVVPETLDDRGADIATPLLAIADACGRGWASKAGSAVLELRGADLADDRSAHVELLRDIREGLHSHTSDKISTQSLLLTLTATGKRWATCDHGRPLNPRGLADMLKPLGIHSTTVRLGEAVLKGYRQSDLSSAFEAYLPQVDMPADLSEGEMIGGDLPDLSELAEDPSEDSESV